MTPGQPSANPPGPLPDVRLVWTALVGSVDCYVAVIDRQRRILFLNRCAEGYDSVQATIGTDLLDYIPQASQELVRGRIEEVFRDGRTTGYDVTGSDPSGVEACYAVRIAPVFEDGRVVAAVTTALDMRRLSGMEASLVAERTVLRKLIETQERERQLVSYEIHDGLAQYLASALMRLEACSAALATAGPRASPALAACEQDCEEGLRLLRAALVEARRLINGLRPPMLDELGIVEAIESLVSDARIEIPEVIFTKPDALPRLPPEVETTIFRIVQEALTNARKHASARRVNVALEPVATSMPGRRGAAFTGLRVAVSDDGRGFDPATVPTACFGLEGIRQRARLFGTEASIKTRPRPAAGSPTRGDPGGTVVEVLLPLPSESPVE
jgi:signal transduction histidine kinase